MVERLKSPGKNPRLILLSKAAIFGVALVWFFGAPGRGYLSAILFLALALFLYLKPLWNSATMLRSFGGLMALVFLSIAAHRDFRAAAAVSEALRSFVNFLPILGALIFYIILGLKEYILVQRRFWHFLVFSLIFYQILFFYFLFEKSFNEFYILFPVVSGFVLFAELLALQTKAGRSSVAVAAALFGLLVMEGILVSRLLPFGFLNSANMVALGGLFFAELALNFYNGLLGWRVFISRSAIFILLALAILLTSVWGL